MARKSPREMVDAMIQSMPSRTGKPLEQWIRIVKSKGPATRKERIAWLRSTHGIGLPTAMVIASETEGENMAAVYDDHDALVDAMYKGKEKLRPIYETVAKAVKKLGKDAELMARRGYVSVARKRQFAAIQPSTKSRVDLGLVLPGVRAQGALVTSKNVGGGRVTHRIALEKKSDFDAEAKKWLQSAFHGDA